MARSDKILHRGTRKEPPAPKGAVIHKRSREYRELEHALKERMKELNLMLGITRLLHVKGNDLPAMFRELAAMLPPAWQYPYIGEARICYGDIEVSTPLWEETPWMLTADFATSDGEMGQVALAYVKPPPEDVEEEDFFLPEERVLIASVAELLAAWLERRLEQGTATSS